MSAVVLIESDGSIAWCQFPGCDKPASDDTFAQPVCDYHASIMAAVGIGHRVTADDFAGMSRPFEAALQRQEATEVVAELRQCIILDGAGGPTVRITLRTTARRIQRAIDLIERLTSTEDPTP